MNRWTKHILWLLPAGAAVTVLVAWACARWGERPGYSSSTITEVADDDAPRSSWEFLYDSAVVSWRGNNAGVVVRASDDTLGCTRSLWMRLLDANSQGSTRAQDHRRFGIPFRALEYIERSQTDGSMGCPGGSFWRLPDYRGGWPIAPAVSQQTLSSFYTPHVYPLAILPWGFVANTLIYTTLLAAHIALFTTIRAHLRRRRGLCATCAYPHGPTPTCPECGTARKHPTTPAIPP